MAIIFGFIHAKWVLLLSVTSECLSNCMIATRYVCAKSPKTHLGTRLPFFMKGLNELSMSFSKPLVIRIGGVTCLKACSIEFKTCYGIDMSLRTIVSVGRFWSTTFAPWFDGTIAINFSKRSRNWTKHVSLNSNTNWGASVWHAQVYAAANTDAGLCRHPPTSRHVIFHMTIWFIVHTTWAWQTSCPSHIIVDIYTQSGLICEKNMGPMNQLRIGVTCCQLSPRFSMESRQTWPHYQHAMHNLAV